MRAHDIPEALRQRFREMESVWLTREASQLRGAEVEDAIRAVLVMGSGAAHAPRVACAVGRMSDPKQVLAKREMLRA